MEKEIEEVCQKAIEERNNSRDRIREYRELERTIRGILANDSLVDSEKIFAINALVN